MLKNFVLVLEQLAKWKCTLTGSRQLYSLVFSHHFPYAIGTHQPTQKYFSPLTCLKCRATGWKIDIGWLSVDVGDGFTYTIESICCARGILWTILSTKDTFPLYYVCVCGSLFSIEPTMNTTHNVPYMKIASCFCCRYSWDNWIIFLCSLTIFRREFNKKSEIIERKRCYLEKTRGKISERWKKKKNNKREKLEKAQSEQWD